MSVKLNSVKSKESNSNSFGNSIENHTTGITNLTDFKVNVLQAQSTPLIKLSAAEFKALDRKFASNRTSPSKIRPNRLVKLQRRLEEKSKYIEQIRQNVARKIQEHKELTEVIKNTKRKKAMHDSVKNINQILKKPGMDIPRSMITRLMFDPDDYITRYNYPQCLDEFTTVLYKCSPDAYKLIQETFGNVLPEHSKVV